MTESKVLFGQTVTQGKYRPITGRAALYLESVCTEVFAISQSALFRHILMLGGSGSGKTNVLTQILPQLRVNAVEDHVTLVFDTKADYYHHPECRKPGDIVLGSSRDFREVSCKWNLFAEVLADGPQARDYEANAREIAAILFKERISEHQPFFGTAARDIFAHSIIYLIRQAQQNTAHARGRLNNRDLVTFLMGQDIDVYRQCFDTYPDMRGLNSYFGDGNNLQALGVFGELRSMVSECFRDVFAEKSDLMTGFSMRRAIREKGRKAIFVEYDLSVGESMMPVYRLLVDLALKEALSATASGHTYLLLDELKLLPKVTHLEDALNFGRSQLVSVIAGIQNVNQIYAIYGRERGQVILGGFGTVFAFNTPDVDSRDYVRSLLGTNVVGYRYTNAANQPIDRERDGHTVEDWQLRGLAVGEAVIRLATQAEPFVFQFALDEFAR